VVGPPTAPMRMQASSRTRSNCYLPLQRPEVKAYIAELKAQEAARQAERLALQDEANAEAAREFVAKTKLDRQFILDRLRRIAEIADGTENLKVSLIEDGKAIEAEESHIDLSQARQTWALLGSELFGMFPQRSKVDANVTTPAPAEPVKGDTREAALSYLAGWGSRHVAAPKPETLPDAPVPAPTVAETGTA
jgi:hypothetical protein